MLFYLILYEDKETLGKKPKYYHLKMLSVHVKTKSPLVNFWPYIFFLNSMKIKIFKSCIFIADSLYTILKLIPYRKILPTIYNMPGPGSINF